jgi:hypothetical protein
MQHLEWLRATVQLAEGVVEDEDEQTTSIMMLAEARGEYPGCRKVVAGDDGARPYALLVGGAILCHALRIIERDFVPRNP